MALISKAVIQQFRYLKGSAIETSTCQRARHLLQDLKRNVQALCYNEMCDLPATLTDKAGLFTTHNGTQTELRTLSSIFPDRLKHPLHRCSGNSLDEYQIKKGVTENTNTNELKVGKLKAALRSDITEKGVLQAFSKLLTAYEVSLLTPSIKTDLDDVINSKAFTNFCRQLERNVDKFSLQTLLLLYNLEFFNVPQTNSLMKTVSKLVLEKLKTASLYEKLLIYGATLSKSCKEKNRKNIIDECEAYVKKSLDYDLHCKVSPCELSSLFDIKHLPKHVKLALVEKLTDEILHNAVDRKFATAALHKMACEEDDFLPKETWLNLIQYCLGMNSSQVLLKKTCLTYITLLQKDVTYYSPEVVNMIIKKICGKGHALNTIQIGEGLCEMGYISKEFLDEVINNLLNLKYLKKTYPLNCVLSFLAQSSFHELVTESTAQQVKKALENNNIFEIISDLPDNSLWCMYLTYIGCDTRVLLSSIFKRANNETETTDSNLLTLHHLAKAYFPGEYESLSQKIVNNLVENQFKTSGLWDPQNSIGKCFESEDLILRNCITSDRHCLDFVTVFQYDRKPVNLASYSKMLGPKEFCNVDTIKIPQGSKMIAFICFPYKQPIKFLNLPSLSGSAKMYLKSFMGVSCHIVLLHKTFFGLSLEDKKKFLKSQIDEIFENS